MTNHYKIIPLLVLATTFQLQGCGGGGSGGGGGGTGTNPEVYFADKVEPLLADCKLCHYQGGAADVEGGNLLLLNLSGSNYATVYLAWDLLGRGVESNPILANASQPEIGHTGGYFWPIGSQPYNDVHALLSCWDDSMECNSL